LKLEDQGHPPKTMIEPFQRAFVATSYLIGQRELLTAGLVRPSSAAVVLAQRLGEGDRNERARRLASELRPIVEALDARRVR
jgi:hypothetical protein